ncbi:MAG: hypothetical protein Q8929_05245 [Bacillota bacterium]|nr:hypothetical protein [Bacillota bacterium]
MAYIHMAQVANLTQDLIERLTIATNLVMRNKHELERMQQIMQMLCTVYDDLEKDWRDERR